VLLLLTVLLVVLAWRYAARKATGPRPWPRFVGPDDDIDFLRELDRRTRRDDEKP